MLLRRQLRSWKLAEPRNTDVTTAGGTVWAWMANVRSMRTSTVRMTARFTVHRLEQPSSLFRFQILIVTPSCPQARRSYYL